MSVSGKQLAPRFGAATVLGAIALAGSTFIATLAAGAIRGWEWVGDWAELPAVLAVAVTVVAGVFGAIVALRRTTVVPKWQWRSEFAVSCASIVLIIAIALVFW